MVLCHGLHSVIYTLSDFILPAQGHHDVCEEFCLSIADGVVYRKRPGKIVWKAWLVVS